MEIKKSEFDRLDSIKGIFEASSKSRNLFLSTTANKKNPDFYIASIKENSDTIICHFLVKNFAKVKLAYEYLNIDFDTILVDVESKCEYKDLLSDAKGFFQDKNIATVKPNDFTVQAVDLFLASKENGTRKLDVAILGTGNLGSKICLKLIERGHNTTIQSRSIDKLNNIKKGLDAFKCGEGNIDVTTDLNTAIENKNVIINCAPGLPVLEQCHAEQISKETLIIDVGNGTLTKEAITILLEQGNEIYVLNSLPGLLGEIEAIKTNTTLTNNLKIRRINDELRVISTGIIGQKGDIIVDNVDDIKSIIGVCDGSGDLLKTTEADTYLRKLNEYIKR